MMKDKQKPPFVALEHSKGSMSLETSIYSERVWLKQKTLLLYSLAFELQKLLMCTGKVIVFSKPLLQGKLCRTILFVEQMPIMNQCRSFLPCFGDAFEIIQALSVLQWILNRFQKSNKDEKV